MTASPGIEQRLKLAFAYGLDMKVERVSVILCTYMIYIFAYYRCLVSITHRNQQNKSIKTIHFIAETSTETNQLLNTDFQPSGPMVHGRTKGADATTLSLLRIITCGQQGWGTLLLHRLQKGHANLLSPRCNITGQGGWEMQLDCGACIKKRAALFSYLYWFLITCLWFKSWGTTALMAPTAPGKCKQRYQIVVVLTAT